MTTPQNGSSVPLPPLQKTPVTGGPVLSSAAGKKTRRWGGFDVVALVFSGLAVIAGALAFLRASQTNALLAQLVSTQNTAVQASDTAGSSTPTSGPIDIAVDSYVPYVGNADAKVTVVEFSDFQCPFCKQFETTAQQIRNNYQPDQVRFVYMHFPLTEIHPNAEPAAIAAQCVMDLAGSTAFFSYHDQLFAHQAELGDKLYYTLATAIPDLSKDQFTDCYQNKKSLTEVQDVYNLGLQVGVEGTPTTYINGEQVPGGAVSFDKIKPLIDSALKN